jgi:predicted amidophosphoribosyltransferase
VDPEQWWYPGCSCHSSLSPIANGFYCNDCDKDVTYMLQCKILLIFFFGLYTLENKLLINFMKFHFRFKLKLRIKDGTGQEIFVLFDQEMYELLGKHCHELLTVHEVDIQIIVCHLSIVHYIGKLIFLYI